jgi:hypothetical protein
MGEVVRFIPKSERERTRLIREARAMHDSVFPLTEPARDQRGGPPASHGVNGNARCSDEDLPS